MDSYKCDYIFKIVIVGEPQVDIKSFLSRFIEDTPAPNSIAYGK